MQNFFRYFFIFFFINYHVYGDDALYSIKDNQVFLQNDNNILDLRESAKFIAFENAFSILVKKIIEPKDLIKLNRLEDVSVEKLVNDYKITNEDISEISYSANISVNFNQNLILQFFKKNNIRVQTLVSDIYLIFPILKKFNTFYLWEKNNNWYNSLKSEYDNDGLLKLYFPEQNHLNKLRISSDHILNNDFETIKNFLKIHKKNKAIIIVLEETFDNDLKKFKTQVDLSLLEDNYKETIKIFGKTKYEENSSTSQIKLVSKIVINELQNWWKLKVDDLESQTEEIKELFVEHNFLNLKKNIFVENILKKIFSNDEVTLTQINSKSAYFKILSSSSIDKINLSLETYGLTLKQKTKNIYFIEEIN